MEDQFVIKRFSFADKDFDSVSLCMEDQLRTLGILGNSDDSLSSILNSKMFKAIDLDSNTLYKKVRLLDVIMVLFQYPYCYLKINFFMNYTGEGDYLVNGTE